jgi:multicomponent Na+:H+ antiporter subunit F
MFEAASVVVLLAIPLALYRAIRGPLVYDRVLAANVIGTKTMVLIALIGFAFGRPHFLDIALVYALINFLATIAVLKYRASGGLN